MTNMEGVGLLFILIIFGVPLFFLFVTVIYLMHRRKTKLEEDNNTQSLNKEPPISSLGFFRGIFLEPDNLFSKISEGKTNLFRPFILITIGSIFFVFGYMPAADIVFFESFLHGEIIGTLLIGLGLSLLVVIPSYIAWIILAAGFFIVSKGFKGTGFFSTILQNTGYGVAVYLVVSGALFFLFSVVYLILVNNHILDYYDGPLSLPLYLQLICYALPLFWSVTIWSYGLKHARKIPFSHAVTSVCVIVILGVLLLYGRVVLSR